MDSRGDEQEQSSQLIPSTHYTIWQLIKSYWRSHQKFSAYMFFIVITAMTIAIVLLDVVFNYWYSFFYDALQAYNKPLTIRLLEVFFTLALIYIIIAVYRFYISQLFGIRWRRWLTDQLILRWLQKKGYFYLEHFDEKTDNPDQRIQEDAGALVNTSIDLFTGIVGAVVTFFAFLYVLWKLSGLIHISFGKWGTLYIPGYLVWVGVIYSAVGTFFTFKIGTPLVALNFEQQKREATFRFSAMDLRSHAEHVALYRGEDHEKNVLQKLLNSVLENWYFIVLRQKLLLWFTAGYNQASVLLPLLVALPNYFEKVFLLGGLIQTLQAFGRVQDSLSFLVTSYTRIAEWQAIGQRLSTFTNHVQEAEQKAEKNNEVIFSEQKSNIIDVTHLSIKTPQGLLLLQNINEQLTHGTYYLIKGKSGIGKSTFIRTIANIWPYAKGKIILPEDRRIMYVPQKPYMPIGSLAEAMLFPDKLSPNIIDELPQLLRACNLPHLIPRLKEIASWSEQLSPGEQQRIAFARILLQKPDWVFLDESTSMVDTENETHLYQLLKTRLSNCSIVSVGHRSSLVQFHQKVINMEQYMPPIKEVVE